MKFLVLLLALFISSGTNNYKYNVQAEKFGSYLIKEASLGSLQKIGVNDHPGIVRLGEQAANKLESLNHSISNSCYPEAISSDGEETNTLFIICDNKKIIGFRLRYDDEYGKFHLLGYWTSGL